MHARVSLNLVSAFDWSLSQDLAFCRSIGLAAVTLPMLKLADSHERGIEQVRAAGLRCVAVATGARSLIDSGARTLEVLGPAIDVAHALGSPSCYTVSGGVPERTSTDEAYARLVRALGPAVDYARERGLRLGVEHNSVSTREHGFVHTLADAASLSRDTGSGICLELQNCWTERNLERLFRENVERFDLVQVSDYRVGEEIRYNRRVPGDGSLPLEWLLGRLLDAGYAGPFDLEILGPHIESEGYAPAIRRGLDWLSERLESWGI